MSKKFLFINTSKLMGISAGVLLVIFCMVGMSFTPEDGEGVTDPSDSTYVTGPRRSHWTTSQTSGSGCNQTTTYTYHHKNDYGKVIAHSLGGGSVGVSGNHTTSASTNSSATSAGTTSYVTWNSNMSPNENTDASSGTEPTEAALIMAHTNEVTFTATPAEGYYFVGWYAEEGCTTQKSDKDHPEYSEEFTIPNYGYTGSSENTQYQSSGSPWTQHRYAKFAVIPGINITFLAPSTPSVNRGTYTVTSQNTTTTISTSNETIEVKGTVLEASLGEAYEFVDWYKRDGSGTETIISTENPSEQLSFLESVSVGVHWRELHNNMNMTFKAVELDGDDNPVGSYTVNSTTVTTSDYVYNTGSAYRFSPTLKATPEDGYIFTGWYIKNGKKKEYLSTESTWTPTFTDEITLYAGFAFVGYTEEQKAQFKANGQYFTDLNAANNAAKSASTKTIICTRDGILPPGNYEISSGVTLYIPYSTSESSQTKPAEVTTAETLSAYRTLTFADGANVTVAAGGKICVGGKIMAAGGGSKSAYVTGPCGVINMANGGHIELNGTLYCWGLIKGQDMDQGNNTLDVGTITANTGSVVWEDFAVGDWRGGTATSAINNKKSQWKLFPFQSYSIQNIEVPTTYKYGSTLSNYVDINSSYGTEDATFDIIGSSGTLFLLKNTQSTVRKWYDPTTDLTCYELNGTAQLDELNIYVYISVSSGQFYLPISNSMQIIINCDMTLSKPMTMQAGSVIEITKNATVNLEARLHMFDKDEWGLYIHDYYFRSFNNLTNHKNRGEENSNAGLDDAKLIVDGTLNVVSGKGYIYSTAGGANIMGNGGGKVVFGGALPSGTETLHHVRTGTKAQSYIQDAPNDIAAANLCNEDGSYTKSIASSTFYNIHGRWFTAAAKDGKANHTYDFTYISSGAVSGTGGTSSTTDAVYSWDKTGLELRQKWANVTYSCEGTDENDNTHYWWHGQGEQSSWFYNWTLNSDWHQFMPTATEGMYSGSNNKIYTKTDCAWEELGETDVNCLYEIGGVKKALVDGQFIALEPNNNDPAYHAADDATKYYICFSGCNWHEATKYENAEKAYVVDEDIFIWYDGEWMNAEWRDPFFYTLDETDVPIYYEYLNGEWVLSDPYIRVTDGLESRTYWFLNEAFAFASGALRKTPTIKILRDISGITTAVSYTGANKTCTLDLNGHTITGSVSSMLTINGAGCTFIIKDNTAEKKGKINLVFSANTRRYAVNVTKGHLKLQSGTISSTNTMLYSQGTSATSCAIIVKASQQCTIEGGTVYTQADYNPIGIYGDGNSSTITVKGGEVIASVGAKSEPRGIQVTGGTLNVQDDAVIEATTYAGGTTGEGILVNQNASYHATLNMTGGTVKSTTKSSSIGVYVNCTYTYDTNEPRTITAWSRAEAYISGGEIRVENKNGATAEGVRSLGTTEISGGKITVRPTTSTAIGVRLYDGTTTIKGTADIDVAATSVAYGVRISEEAPANKAGTVYNGTLNMTGGTLTVRTTGTTDAYGVYVGAASTKITTTHASNSSYYAGNYANAGTANISNGVIDVQAKTNKAYSVYVENPVSESGATGYATATATPNCSITGGKFKVASMTANATNIAATNVSTSTYTISGGYYNNQENVAGYTVAPKHVVTLPTTDANYPEYLYKVANSYLVTFMNGDETLQSTYQEEGKVPTYTEAEPTKASAGGFSYAFNGWSTSNDNTPAALTAVTSAGATYYACFEQTDLRYTISLDATTNGGECATEYIRVAPGAAAGELPSATKEGHTFTGWFTAASGGTQLTASTVVSGDITYYAQFTVNSYTLTYALGEGKVTTAGSPIPAKNKTGTQSQSVAYGTAITAPVVARTGYTFQSWDAIVAATMPAENVTYTPLWIPNVNTKYTVKHYQQNVDGTYPADPVETQSLTGTTATSVTPEVKSYDGFVSPAAQTVTIAAAGTTVVEYQYARRHYTFTLDAYTNGGTSEVPSIEVIHGATIGAVPPDAQKGCNDFTGWYTQPVGGVKITPEFVIEYDMKTLYAQFSDDVRTYPIIYNAGANGTGTIDAGVKTCGVDAVLASATFTRDGYAQTGWSLTDGGAQAYALGGTYTANASLTLYPVWSAVTYSVRFNKNDEDATGTMSNESFTYDVANALTSNAFTKTGYNFAGWATSAGGNVVYTDGQSVSNLSATQGAVVDMYAKWTANTYEVALNANGGTGGSTSVTMTYNSVDHTAITNPTRTGYTFHSWNTTTSSSTRKMVISSKGVLSENVAGYTGAGGVWIRTTMPTTLYARWSQKSYPTTFTHNGNGSISYDGAVVDAGGTAKVYHVSAKNLVATPNTGYHFTGWTVSGTNASKVTIADLSAASTTIKATAASATVTAGFAPYEYTISYKDQGDVTFSGTHADGYPTSHTYGTATTLKTATKTGYTFGGWYTTSACTGDAVTTLGATAYTAAITLYAKWTPNTNTAYTVKHFKQALDGSYAETPDDTDNLTGTTGAEVTPAVKDYTGFTAPSTQTVTILANGSRVVEYYYTRNSHKVTWDATTNGGSCETAYSMVKHGATIGTLPVATKAGHEFLGWFTTYSGGGNQVTAATMITNKITFYARFKPNNFNVTFDVQGHGTAPDAQSITANGKVTEPADPSAENYRFDGWYKEPACTNAWDFASDVVTADMILYAKWTLTPYDITLHTNDGTINSGNVTSYTYGVGATLPNDVTRIGYDFDGWFSNSECTGDAVTTISATTIGDKEFWAKWTPIQYTITWLNYNGSDLDPSIESFNYFGEHPAYSTVNYGIPTRAESNGRTYEWDGWTTEVNGSGTFYPNDELPEVQGDVTYYAHFRITAIEVKTSNNIEIDENSDVEVTVVHVNGTLTVEDGATLTTNDLILEATPTTSGEIIGREAQQAIAANGTATFKFSQPGGFTSRTWYSVAVPWQVDVPHNADYTLPCDIYAKKGEGAFARLNLGSTIDIIYYDGIERAANGHSDACWKYVEDDGFEEVMMPGKAYMFKLLNNADTLCFVRKSNTPLRTRTTEVVLHNSGSTRNENWNGIANPATYHAYLDARDDEEDNIIGYIYDGDKKQYKQVDMDKTKLVVGQAVYIQAPKAQSIVANPTVYANPSQANLAPRRVAANDLIARYDVYLGTEEETAIDRVVVRVDEDKEDEYVIAKDLVKFEISPKVAQMWVNCYDERLAMNTLAPVNDQAIYPLGISVPQAGEYHLYVANELAEDDNLYLTYDGRVIWNIGYAPYVLSLEKGVNEHYGLRLIHNAPGMEMDVDQVEATRAAQKMLIDQKVYILRGEQLYSITGQKAE